MSSIIQQIKNTTGDSVYPVTKTSATYDDNGNRLDNTLTSINDSLSYKDISSEITITDSDAISAKYGYIENGVVYCLFTLKAGKAVGFAQVASIPTKYAPRITTFGTIGISGASADLGKIRAMEIGTSGIVKLWNESLSQNEYISFTYPLRRS